MFDFHCHTVYSDGAARPEALVNAAISSGVKAMAITDHDTTRSYPIAKAAVIAANADLDLIPGIEINTVWKNHEVHVLGYFIDPDDTGLQDLIQRHHLARKSQMKAICKKLQKKIKCQLSFEDVCRVAGPTASLGRPHMAQALVKLGVANTIGEAFQKYLMPSCATYERRDTATPHEAVEAIYDSGGIPVIAHPGEMPDFENLVRELMNVGLRGLEAYHRSHSPAMIEFHASLAERFGLIVTGGTDFHGVADNYCPALNRLYMPPHIYDSLKQDKANRSLNSIRLVS
jgi:3',5'-nucleoside bisphosphate phosphatase